MTTDELMGNIARSGVDFSAHKRAGEFCVSIGTMSSGLTVSVSVANPLFDYAVAECWEKFCRTMAWPETGPTPWDTDEIPF